MGRKLYVQEYKNNPKKSNEDIMLVFNKVLQKVENQYQFALVKWVTYRRELFQLFSQKKRM